MIEAELRCLQGEKCKERRGPGGGGVRQAHGEAEVRATPTQKQSPGEALLSQPLPWPSTAGTRLPALTVLGLAAQGSRAAGPGRSEPATWSHIQTQCSSLGARLERQGGLGPGGTGKGRSNR